MKVSDNKRWYWGIEPNFSGEKPKLVERGHLMVTDPPYIQGSGVRIRFWGTVISIGRVTGEFARPLTTDAEEIGDEYIPPEQPDVEAQTEQASDSGLVGRAPTFEEAAGQGTVRVDRDSADELVPDDECVQPEP